MKPGDLVWVQRTPEERGPRRSGVIIRKSLCKDFSSWDRRNRCESGETFARRLSSMCWLVMMSTGSTELIFEGCIFKRQYRPRPCNGRQAVV